jgi:hypothetical protein
VEPRDAPANPSHDAAHTEAAFGASPNAASPWAPGGTRRLTLLLACLLASVSALLATRGTSLGFGRTQAGNAYSCPGAHAPEVASVARADLPALRGQLATIVPAPLGRVYETGSITTSNLWSDNDPQAPSSGSTVPAGYEIRWWTLDRDGDEDDVAADVLEFATPKQARRALALAASPRCRTDGAAHAARFPSGARELHWVNPDKAQQWDVLFARGRRLYRVGDVPPEYLFTTTGPRTAASTRERDETTPQALACVLPDARCAATAPTIADSSLATLATGTATRAANARPPTDLQASTYAHAVNLPGYLVPGLSLVAPEGPMGDRGTWGAFARCAGAQMGAHSVVVRHSPVFEHGSRFKYEVVYSLVAVEPSSAQAASYLTSMSNPRARACIARAYERLQRAGMNHAGSPGASQVELRSESSSGMRVERVTLTPLSTPTPISYRGSGPYRATALRLRLQLSYLTRRGRLVRAPLYLQSFLFADGAAVVGLGTFTFRYPYPQENQRFLERLLVGRAEANEGLL